MELYKRLLLILTTGIMMAGLISFKIDASTRTVQAAEGTPSKMSPSGEDNAPTQPGNNLSAEVTPSLTDLPSDETTPTAVTPDASDPAATYEPIDINPESNPLKPEVYPQIHALIENYFKAKLSCDLEAFRDIVTDVSYINIEAIARATESVKDYTELKVYTKRGYGPIDTVVYCTFKMIVPNVDSPIDSIDSFYIVNDENGNPKIFSGILEDSVAEKLAEMDNGDDVLALKTYVATEIEHAMQKDDTLVEFWENMLNGIPANAISETEE